LRSNVVRIDLAKVSNIYHDATIYKDFDVIFFLEIEDIASILISRRRNVDHISRSILLSFLDVDEIQGDMPPAYQLASSLEMFESQTRLKLRQRLVR